MSSSVRSLFLQCIEVITKENVKYEPGITLTHECVKIIELYKQKKHRTNWGQLFRNKCKEGNINIVKLLVSNRIDPCYILQGFRMASRYNHLEIVKWMIGQEIIPEYVIEQGFRWAYEHGAIDIVKFFVNQGYIANGFDDAFRLVSQSGYYELVEFFVEKGANINSNHCWAIQWASGCGHLKIVQFLVKKGADVHIHNNFPRRWAFENKHFEVVKYLDSI